MFLNKGFMSAPVVVVDQPVASGAGVKEFGNNGVAWAGLNPDAIAQLVKANQSE